METIRVEKTEWLVRVIFDLPGEKVNKLSSAVMVELEQVVRALSHDSRCEVISFESAKKDIFIAGADIAEFSSIESQSTALSKVQAGQALFSFIADLPQTTVAVIDGACIGGGCELALACDFRMASDNPKTQIGLVEVQLGIIPGWGGTQRLPRLIGLPAALQIILPGKTVDARKAKRIKLVDHLVSAALVEEEQQLFLQKLRDSAFCLSLKKKRKAQGKIAALKEALLETTLGRALVIKQARKKVLKKTKGFYPAPLAVLDLLSTKCTLSEGLEKERIAFAKLAVSEVSRNLVALFFLQQQLKKAPGADFSGETVLPKAAAVLGAGVMGGGIAWLMSSRGLAVRMKDISWDAIALGYAEAAGYFAQLKKRRRIKQRQIDHAMNRIGAAVDYHGFSDVDIVIEAVVENMEIKKQVLAESELYLADSALLFSNTSALSITEMASALQRPANFCGMHFFNPVNRMPLVEIVRGERSSEATLANAVAMVKAWGKMPVVVKDSPGFLVNRILLPYINEAAYLLQEGADIEMLDKTLIEFGMPLGPFELVDQVGIDVGYKVAKILEDGFGARMATCPLLTTVFDDLQLLGKKGGAGFYKYGGKAPVVNPAIARFATDRGDKTPSAEEITERLLILMVNEAARCLDEGVVGSAGELDFAMIMGTGFPAWRGGLCRWADNFGLKKIVNKCDRFNAVIDERYQVSPYLRELVSSGRSFYS
ncbi:MAG: 3-hydroxyacyl-CoA dehydrogenase NAD-binding domain-containing protein [Psychromonas sp.]|nr:3-hydroxyacyl-CoA dehydrogenase NAD-binding domain-containing protein [Psychromonas sp.]